MTFDNELKLIAIAHSKNAIGDPIKTPVSRSILCGLASVKRSEHYQAAATGLKPSIVFIINKYDYDGEKEIEFEKQRYKVMRTYTATQSKGLADFETLELVCEGVVNRANA